MNGRVFIRPVLKKEILDCEIVYVLFRICEIDKNLEYVSAIEHDIEQISSYFWTATEIASRLSQRSMNNYLRQRVLIAEIAKDHKIVTYLLEMMREQIPAFTEKIDSYGLITARDRRTFELLDNAPRSARETLEEASIVETLLQKRADDNKKDA